MSEDRIYKCLDCKAVEIDKSTNHKMDGRTCRQCNGPIALIGYPINYIAKQDIMTLPNGMMPYISKDTGRIEVISTSNMIDTRNILQKKSKKDEYETTTLLDPEKSFVTSEECFSNNEE